MSNLNSQELGNGHTLVFQRNAKDGTVRAVVKGPAGTVIIRGPVVPEKDADISRRAASLELSSLTMPSASDSTDFDDDYEEDKGTPEEDMP
jgi:hypothetical protein